MREPIRILQINPSISKASGITSVLLNWHRNIDRTKVQFDYFYYFDTESNVKEEILALGGRLYKLPYRGIMHPASFIKAAAKVFRENKYTTVHSHVTQLNFLFFPMAKYYGVKNIISHAHGTKWSDKFLNGVRNYLMLGAARPFITRKAACSNLAGKAWYGSKDFYTINNGIEVEKFPFNADDRTNIRRELGIEDKFVIGHIGRFNEQKNHTFLIDIFEQVYKKDKTARLLLVGSGPLEDAVKKQIKRIGLDNVVLLLGVRKDAPLLYQAMDVFLMPSLYEGLPVAGVEAQCSGLPAVMADTITPEALVANGLFLSLKSSPAFWAKEILRFKTGINQRKWQGPLLKEKGFDIKDIGRMLTAFYLNAGCVNGGI